MSTIDKITAELKKAKKNNPDLNVGKIMYFVQCLAEDSREKSIYDVDDKEFLDMLKTVCFTFKYIQEPVK